MSTVFAAPCDIRFTQSSIKGEFRDGRTLAQTACQLAREEIEKRDIEMIKVVRHRGELWSLDNRRLAVFRLLQLVGKVRCIKAAVIPMDPRAWHKKFDTQTDGLRILVRGSRYEIGISLTNTTFPLEDIRASLGGQRHGGIALQSMSELDSDDESDMTSFREVDVANRASKATYEPEPKWQGSHKLVAQGRYTEGAREGDGCVVKWFKSGPVYSDANFDDDLRAIVEARRIVSAFNAAVNPNRRVYVNEAQVWVKDDERDPQKLLVEPLIRGAYQHFNSNTGYQADGFEIMAALSHFSYHFSDGRAVLCDLQGGRYENAYVLTDPVVLSVEKKYGATDLGQQGIDHFFSQHRCSSLCRSEWRRPQNERQLFEVCQGSTLVIGNRIQYGAKRFGTGRGLGSLAE